MKIGTKNMTIDFALNYLDELLIDGIIDEYEFEKFKSLPDQQLIIEMKKFVDRGDDYANRNEIN